MIPLTMDFTEFILANTAIIEPIMGAIVMLLSFMWKPLERGDRLGNIPSRIWLSFLLIVGVTIVAFGLSEWWLLLCLCPLLHLILRWFCFRRCEKRVMKTSGEDRDIALFNYINQMTDKTLYEWEIRCFVLPHLIIYFEIGAIKTLTEKLSKYRDYKTDAHYAELEGLISAVKHESSAMLSMMKKDIISEKIRKDESYPLFINNLYHAAMTKGDQIAIDCSFGKIEDYVASADNPYKIPIQMLEAMMYRYDERNDNSGISKVRSIMAQRKPRNFNEYLLLGDIELFYNRRHNKRNEICKYLDEMVDKVNVLEKDEEKRLRFKLRIVLMFVEFNYKWEEITSYIFSNAETYLNYSSQIATEYLKMLVRVVGDAYKFYGKALDERQETVLMKQAFQMALPHIENYKKKIFNLDNQLLYKKREGYRLLIDYARVSTYLNGSLDDYAGTLIAACKEIISLCRENEEVSELAHSLMSYIDEFIILKMTIQQIISRQDIQQHKEDAFARIQAEEPRVKEYLDELINLLRRFNYDRASAYETLWTAHFCAMYKRIPEAKLHLQKFQEHKVSVRNYTKPVQDMYHNLTDYLSRV